MSNRTQIEQRVIQTAMSILHTQQYVSPIDVLLGIGLLQPVHLQEWKKGRVSYLEKVIQGNLSKISFAMRCFRSWAQRTGLKASKTAYLVKTRGPKRKLRFSKSGYPQIEETYQTHYISPLLSERKQEKLKEKWEKSPDLVIFMIINPTQCSQCKKDLFKGNLLFMEAEQPLCLCCAGFEDLVFISSGDAKLTRTAKKHSDPCFVVVRFSRARKRYERQGLLIQKEALQKAKNEIENTERGIINPRQTLAMAL